MEVEIDLFGGGRVELLDVMGSDLSVVNAARVSFAKESAWHGWSGDLESDVPPEPYLSDRDQSLIRYLARNGHWTPFSQPQVQLRIRMPLFVARQWFKHQVGFTRNEVSRRYVDERPEFYLPAAWRARAKDKKQGSAGPVGEDDLDRFHSLAAGLCQRALKVYEELISAGACPEQARMVLPQAMFTEFVETGSLYAYARLIRLRDEEHAQAETREYASAVRRVLTPRFPVSMDALLGEGG